MQFVFDPASVYQYHDLLVELGHVEMAMEHLQARNEREHSHLLPRLESRMSRLRAAISQLPA